MTRNFQKLMKFNRPHNHNLKLNKPKEDKKQDKRKQPIKNKNIQAHIHRAEMRKF